MEELLAYASGDEDEVGGNEAIASKSDSSPERTTRKRKRVGLDSPPNSPNPVPPSSPPRKLPKAKLPALPATYFEEKTPRVNEEEERRKHGGRIRSFPHVEGNYPTYVYLVVNRDTPGLAEVLPRLILDFASWLPDKEVHSFLEEEKQRGAVTQDLLHISLSRTVPLRQHQIPTFVDLLEKTFKGQQSFDIEFGDYEVFVNDEKTRSFVSLRVCDGKDRVCALISIVDKALKEFSLPVFYQDPRPHVTVGWTLDDVTSILNEKMAGELPRSCRMQVTSIYCKSGVTSETKKLFLANAMFSHCKNNSISVLLLRWRKRRLMTNYQPRLAGETIDTNALTRRIAELQALKAKLDKVGILQEKIEQNQNQLEAHKKRQKQRKKAIRALEQRLTKLHESLKVLCVYLNGEDHKE